MQETARQSSPAPAPGDQPGPSEYPDNAVVFRGDGEPKTPASLIRQLQDIQDSEPIEPDSYSLGGSVARLEERFADMLGTETSTFFPTGTMANHLVFRRHCGGKPRALLQERSHVYHDTGDGVVRLSGINLIPLARDRVCFSVEELVEALDEAVGGRVVSPVGAVMIESPVRRMAGRVVPFDLMKAITDACRERGIATHLDGARLPMMSAATGIPVREYTGLFDSVYVSLYKYYGAPFGAILGGSEQLLADLYHERRMFGGGLPSVDLAAALALRGADGFQERFEAAMAQARALFALLSELPGIAVRPYEDGSNIFPLEMDGGIDSDALAASLAEQGVFVFTGDRDSRVLLLTVNTTILRRDNDDLAGAFRRAVEASSS